jgi:hypothetical protein
MFGYFSGNKAKPPPLHDITVDAESWDQRMANDTMRMKRDQAFLDVHSDKTLKRIMDNSRSLYFWMEEALQSYPAESVQAMMLRKGLGRYRSFVDLLNSESLTYDAAVQGAIALVDGIKAVSRALNFINGERTEEVVNLSMRDEMTSKYIDVTDERFGRDARALKNANMQLQDLKKRQRRGSSGQMA